MSLLSLMMEVRYYTLATGLDAVTLVPFHHRITAALALLWHPPPAESLTWHELTLFMATPLWIHWLIEGGRLVFFALFFPYRLIRNTLLRPIQPPNPNDARLQMNGPPTYPQFLFYSNTPSQFKNTKRHCFKHKQFGIRNRILRRRWNFLRFCYLLLHPRLSDIEFADHCRTNSLIDSSRPTNDSHLSCLGCFNRLAAKNDEELRAIQDNMRWNFKPFYGKDKEAAWRMLQGCINPLDWFLIEKKFWETSPITLASEEQKLQTAYIAAATLKRNLGMDPKESGFTHGIFLTEGGPKCDVPIVFDSGASDSITPFIDDFVSKIVPADTDSLGGLSGTAKVTGMGIVEWNVRDTYGRSTRIRTTAYLVPEATVRLFSPQRYCEQGNGHYHGNGEHVLFTTHEGKEMIMRYNAANRLPLLTIHDDMPFVGVSSKHLHSFIAGYEHSLNDAKKKAYPTASTTSDTVEARELLLHENYNLSPVQKELCLWHYRLCHAGFNWIQDLMRRQKPEYGNTEPPVIQLKKHLQGASNCAIPKCAGCLYSKMHRVSSGSQTKRNKPEREMAIRRDAMAPGDRISIDQYQSAAPGRLPHTYGKEKLSDKYNGGTLFVDHYSGYVFIKNQISMGTGETLTAKHEFERFGSLNGITVKAYHSDNDPFMSKEFQADLELQGQKFTASGTYAHHQNGVAERAIQTITCWARAMLMHQLMHWPDMFEESLWPFAMEHAVHIWNHLPKSRSGLSPHELFTGLKQPEHSNVLRARVWGCPVYVLDPKLCDGHKLPKWQNRSRIGMNLGSSPVHAATVGRVLNFDTGYVSPQFHLVYDELFSSTLGYVSDAVMDGNMWRQLISLNGEENNLDDHDRTDPAVRRIATDMFESFCRDNDPQQDFDPTQDWENPVSEGDRDNDSETSFSSEGAQLENPVSAISPDPEPQSERAAELQSCLRRSGRTRHPRKFLQHDPSYTERQMGNVAEEDLKRVRFQDDADPKRNWSQSGFEKKTLASEGVNASTSFKQTTEEYVRETLLKAPERLAATLFRKPPINTAATRYDAIARQCYLAGGIGSRKVRDRTLNDAFIQSLDWNPSTFLKANYSTNTKRALLLLLQANQTSGEWTPLALQAKAGNEDTPSWDEAMNGPYAEGYWEACKIEYDTLIRMGVWEEVAREPWMNVLPSTWAFRRKLFPNGEVRKLKARFCARGDRQIYGIDFFDTFAPVVNWTTVRLLLTLSAQLGLATKQVDYTAAFVHAPIDLPPGYDKMSPEEQARAGVYVEVPRGFPKPGMVLKLKKSLYGLKQAPRNFFQHLKSKLEKVGFEQQTEVDSCLFISEKVICLVYVDDTLLYARDQKDIDEVLRKLQEEQHMELEVESDVAGFLGVQIKQDAETGEVKLTQTGLINRIIEALKVEDLPGATVPAIATLGKDEDGEPAHCTFNYSSVIGMLWYLYGHSRPDLGFAVSQAARFAFNPKRSHELALIQIGQYLKETREEGMILKPIQKDKFHMDVFVDADFMGLYGKEKRSDPDNVKSRTGFVVCLNGCPIVWASKLQNSISLSTMMAEYYALSTALREVLPIRNSVHAVAEGLHIDSDCLTEFRTTVWEDNNGALTLANLDPGQNTTRSKFFDVKYHWFRSMLKPNAITVVKVDTKDQIADLFTKPLKEEPFTFLRKKMIGW